MKTILLFSTLLLTNVVVFAQTALVTDSLNVQEITIVSDTIKIPTGERPDSILPGTNSYGDLLHDDPVYNPRYPVWLPALRVLMTPAANWVLARYVYKYEWAKISPETWKQNLKGPWVWDKDRFGINFIGHPHTGNYYFNTAKSNGYNYWQSIPFTAGGSLVWELFGENELPSKNDLINTTLSGMFLGEVIYRITSNILDDRATGGNRVFREILAGLINPPRAFNRLTQGKMVRVTNREVYQKEPLNITLSGGVQKANEGKQFGSGATHYNIDIQFDYGDPFEVRKRKPFDVFRLRIESRFGPQRKILDNITGYGILAGKTNSNGDNSMLKGLFQHFDYWNHQVFEVGSLGIGGGFISRLVFNSGSRLFSRFHVAAVPLAGYSTRFGSDTSEFRQYNFGGGVQARLDETFHAFPWLTLRFLGNIYYLGTYDGVKGSSMITILKPVIQFNFTSKISAGISHHIYYHERNARDIPDLRLKRTEQKLFVQIFLEDRNRKGKYF